MKKFFLLYLAIAISVFGTAVGYNGNPETVFSSQAFISYWDSSNVNFQKLNSKLQKDFEKYGHSEKFLKMLFYRSQQHLMDDYNQYASVEDLINEGSFDCVSGSFLMAIFLDHYGFDFDIMETSFHVFLTVNVKDQKIVMESTDSFGGFITEKNDVLSYLKEFKKESKKNTLYLNPKQEITNNLLQPSVYREINLQELKGLELFNRAIFHNNEMKYELAFQKIEEAASYYPSERIITLSKLLQAQLIIASNR